MNVKVLYVSVVLLGIIFCNNVYSQICDPVLESKIEELPTANQDQKIKKAILELAFENACKLSDEGDAQTAEKLISDINDAIDKNMGSLKSVSQNILPLVPMWDGNPYIEKDIKRLESELKSSDVVVYLGDKGAFQFYNNDEDVVHHNVRLFASQIRNYAWAGLHQQSPYYGDAETLKRAFRRAHAYVDAYNRTDISLKDGTINDFFACYSFLDGLLTLKSGAWNFVLPSQRTQWLAAANKAREAWLGYIDDQGGWWDGVSLNGFGSFCNHHITKGMNIQFAGMILEDTLHADVAKDVIALQKISLLPDGGIRYISKQNEMHGYHMVNIEKLVRHWELTGDSVVYEILEGTRNFYPIATEPGFVAEFWTAPYWKYQWYGIVGGSSAEVIAGLFNCGYNRAVAQQELKYNLSIGNNNANANIIAAPYYRSNLKTRERLDDFIVYDRNTMSPRGRYGRFSFVGTTRDYGEQPGKMSFMGCMVTDPPTRQSPLNAALKAVYPKILLDTSKPNWQGSSYLSYQEKNATCVGQNFGSISTSHNMLTATYGHAITPVNWSGDQQWLCFPNRVIGVVTVYPKNDLENAFSVTGHVRLGYGLSNGRKKVMKSLGDGNYSYGDLRIKLHAHNYGETSMEPSPLLRDDRLYGTEIVFWEKERLDEVPTSLTEYKKDQPYYFTVEVYPSWAEPATSVDIYREGNVSGVAVKLKDKKFLMVHNRAEENVEVAPKLLQWTSEGNCALFSSSKGEEISPVPVVVDDELVLSIPAFSHQVLISSADTNDLKSGNYSFDYFLDNLIEGSVNGPVDGDETSHIFTPKANAGTINVYPNPYSEGYLTFEVPKHSGLTRLNIYDINGKSVYQKNFHEKATFETINSSGLALNEGIYFIRAICSDKTSLVQKLIVQ